MGELEQLLGDLGAKQWVKNRFVSKLQEFQQDGNNDVGVFVNEFNREILAEFKEVAKEAVDEVIKKVTEALAPTTKRR